MMSIRRPAFTCLRQPLASRFAAWRVWHNTPCPLRGLGLMLQLALTAVHWWWWFVLAAPGQIMTPDSQYRYFLHIGPESYWITRSFVIAILSTFSLLPLPPFCREPIVGAQAGWFLIVTIMYARVRPYTTGVGAYGAFLFLTLVLARECWRQSGNARQR